MRGLSNPDPILADIIAAAKAGHFDGREAEGPSSLEATPTLVLYEKVQMMSPDRRRIHLAQIGRIRGERTMLSGGKRSMRRKLWLSGTPPVRQAKGSAA